MRAVPSAGCRRSVQQQGVRLHVDHVVPVSKGGQDKMDNLVTACEECNVGKAARMPQA